MMTIILNGKPTCEPQQQTLSELLPRWTNDPSAVAVAVNRQFVSRAEYSSCWVNDGDEVEVLSPMMGG